MVALRFGNLCMDHKILYGTRVNKQTNKLIIRICSEDWEKANIKWKNGDDQIEYNQLRYFKFLPHESNGRLKDKVTIPNIPLISALNGMKDGSAVIKRAIGPILNVLKQECFFRLC
jgi:hypothetical protein